MFPFHPWPWQLSLLILAGSSVAEDLAWQDTLPSDEVHVSLLQLSLESDVRHWQNLTKEIFEIDGLTTQNEDSFVLIPFAAYMVVAPDWLLVSMVGCLDSVCTELPIAIFPLLAPDFMSVAALVAAKPLAQALTSPFSVRLVRSRELFFTQIGLALQISGLLIQALMCSFSFFCIARALQGIASALLIQASPLTTNRFEAAQSGIAVKFIYAGLVCGTPFGALTFSTEPFLPFLSLALAELVLLIAIWLSWGGLEEEKAAEPDTATFFDVMYDRVTLKPILLVSLLLMFTGALQTVTPRLLQEEYDFSVVMSGMAWMFQTWPSVFLVFALGPVARFIGFPLLMVGSLVVAGLAAMLAREGSLGVLILELFFSGVAAGCTNSVVPRMLEDVSKRRWGDEKKVFSIMNMFQQIGYVAGPILGATVMTYFGFQCRGMNQGSCAASSASASSPMPSCTPSSRRSLQRASARVCSGPVSPLQVAARQVE
ncbi:hypothetical protein AK812_SmicGene14416 [Symbiodinium microadriaticum]|uniref:Uncharacterized protein n=1 Tax=Symbiodinium microadriaticum TaxID=2951 RepID=A0A1Q9E5J5_SYMMI|nr:hypothetical protein AK812_SmicGene14416 [Symbiodinium microadriaticum]